MELINSLEAAEILEIPEIAIGQCLLDKKIKPVSGFHFDKNEVVKLKYSDIDYLNSLK